MRIPLLTFSIWLVLFVTCTGIGLYARQRFIKVALTWEAALEGFWIGWALCIVLLEFWHFVLPVTKLTLLIFSLIALVCVYQLRANLRPLVPIVASHWRKMLLYGLVLIVITFWLITRMMFSASVNDHGIYYVQTEKWFSTYAIVPGLGNLHGRLAFDSTYLLFTSLFQTWFGLPRAFHAGNGLLMLVAFLQVAYGIVGIWRMGSRAALWQWFSLLSLIPLVQQIVPNWRIGLTTDFPTFVLGVVITIQALKLFQTDEATSPEIFYRLCLLTLLAAVGISIKINFAVWCVGIVVALLVLYRRTIFNAPTGRVRVLLIGAIGLLVLVPWIVRNIILGGYLVYPVAFTALPVSWRIPVQQAVAEAQAIYGWARSPDKNFLTTINNWDWLGTWFQGVISQTFEVILPLTLTALALIRIGFARSRLQGQFNFLWIIPLIASLSLVYWFFTAPDVRFAGAMFWILANSLIVIALITLPENRRLPVVGVVVIVSAVIGLRDIGVFTERGATDAPTDTPVLQQITIGDDTIVAPISGDACGDAPIPCAPGIPNPQLRLRTPGKLADGFWIAQ